MASNASVLCVVHAMIVVGEAVLLLRRAGTGRADGLWAPPGGHLEAGELPTAAVRREVAEELGLVLPEAALRPLATLFFLEGGETPRTGVNVLFRADLDVAPVLRPDPAVTDAAELFPIAEPPVPHLPWIPGALARLSGRGEPYGEYPAP
jgi:ADP-ribose pyrophosphatase YjhB (NUDIX family)